MLIEFASVDEIHSAIPDRNLSIDQKQRAIIDLVACVLPQRDDLFCCLCMCWTASLLQQEWTDLQEPRDPAHVPAGPSETHAVLRHHAGPSRLHQVICSAVGKVRLSLLAQRVKQNIMARAAFWQVLAL